MLKPIIGIGSFMALVVASFTSAAEPEIPVTPGRQVAVQWPARYAPSETHRFWLFLPANYNTEKPLPLLLFLHGSGERGDDLQKVKVHGPPKLVEQEPEKFPFIVISPQSPLNHLPGVDGWQPALLNDLVDQMAERYAVDTDRMYVTGLSMGGMGTVRLCAHYPEKFAAAIPICGSGSTYYGEVLAPVPLWFFHGDRDGAVLVEDSIALVRAIRKQGGKPRLTIYEGVDHDSWTQTYADPAIYRWLLEHRRSQRPANAKAPSP